MATTSPRSVLMHECLAIHFDVARAKLKRLAIFAVVIAVGVSVGLAILVGYLGLVLFCLPLFLVLTSAMPLAVWYADFHRVRKFQRTFETSPQLVKDVVDLQFRMSGQYGQRAVVTMATGELYSLMLPPDRIAALTAAFPPHGDFETRLAAASR